MHVGASRLFVCRPLLAVVMPYLANVLGTILGHLKAVFPPAAACLAAQGSCKTPRAGQGQPATTDLVLDDDEEEDEGAVSR